MSDSIQPYTPEELEEIKREHCSASSKLLVPRCLAAHCQQICPCPTARLIKTVEGARKAGEELYALVGELRAAVEAKDAEITEMKGHEPEACFTSFESLREQLRVQTERAEKTEALLDTEQKLRAMDRELENKVVAQFEAENAALKSKVEELKLALGDSMVKNAALQALAGELADDETLGAGAARVIESLRAEIAELQGDRDEAQEQARILEQAIDIIHELIPLPSDWDAISKVKALKAEAERRGKALEEIAAFEDEELQTRATPYDGYSGGYTDGSRAAFYKASAIAREASTPQPAEEKQGEGICGILVPRVTRCPLRNAHALPHLSVESGSRGALLGECGEEVVMWIECSNPLPCPTHPKPGKEPSK